MATSKADPRWRRWVTLAITIGLLVAAAVLLDVRLIAERLRSMALGPLALAVVLSTADRVLMAEKWRQLLATGASRVPFAPVLAAYYQATFASHVMPSALAAEVLRGYQATRMGITARMVIASMTMERLVGIAAAALLAAAAAWYLTLLPALLIAGGLMTMLGAGLLAARHPRIRALLVWPSRTLALNLALAVVEHTLQAVTVVIVAVALRIPVDRLQFVAVVMLVLFVRRTIGYFQSWGLAEGATVVLYGRAGLGLEPAAALALATYAVSLIASLPGGVAYLRYEWPQARRAA